MEKLKLRLIELTKISLVCLVFFVLSPSLKAHAMFSDTANTNIGIKLELGTVSITKMETSIVNDVNFTEGNPILIASSKLINDGSLSGKLAYQIDVTKENGSELTTEMLKETTISVDFGTIANKVEANAVSLNSGSFTFVKNSNGSDVVIEPDSVAKVPVSVSYKRNIPVKEEKLKIAVTFRLIQSNALDANDNLFSDTETIENIVSLVPEVVEEKNYWPDKSTFIRSKDGTYTYSMEQMDMVFSEVYDASKSTIKQIKNLNKAVLYISLPKDEPLKTIDYNTGKQVDNFKFFSKTANEPGKVNVESIEIDEGNHGIKVTFNLNDSYDSTNPNKVQEYANKFNYTLSHGFQLDKYVSGKYINGRYEHYVSMYFQEDIYASRLVLDNDIPRDKNAANFERRPILLSAIEKNITIKQIKSNWSNWLENNHFKDILWDKESISLEVIENQNQKLVSYKIKENKTFSLWLNSKNTLSDAILNVKITGDTGNTLVISRKLEVQKDTSMLRKSSLNEEQLVEDVITQSSIEESEEDPAAEVESSTLTVEETAKEVIEEPVNETQKVDDADDLSSSEPIIEVKENVPEVTKEDKEIITGKLSE